MTKEEFQNLSKGDTIISPRHNTCRKVLGVRDVPSKRILLEMINTGGYYAHNGYVWEPWKKQFEKYSVKKV